MKRTLIFIFFGIFLICNINKSVASNPLENYYKKWYFGNQAGIDFFNNNVPVAITTSSLNTFDYGSAVCNSAGNVLFYTNGVTVWDNSNSIMSNGTNLSGSTTGGQTALILRINSEDNLFYIFTVPEFASANGFRYSVVDMGQNGGLGAVTIKNHLLFAPSAEKIAAIYNQADNSYWVIAHQWGNNVFTSYKLSASGLDTVPVLSAIGHINQGGTYGNAHDGAGEMSISPDGHRLACAYNYSATFELYDFDINTGLITNPILISNVAHIWGIEFSPDSKKLYTSLWTQSEVAQYNLIINNSAAIAASKFVAGNVTYSGPYACGYLELAPDGKIYVAKWNGAALSEIDNPDSLGASCGFTNNGFSLSGGTSQCGLSPSPVFPPNTAGITTYSKLLHLDIFPNPVTEQFTIKIPISIPLKNLSVQIISQEGKFVLMTHVKQREIIVNRKKIAPGIYFCELICDGLPVAEEKIVLQ
ncbi:MAG: T9SS type A sorting domain-containing protein [Bacteroidota bacterium]